MQVAMTENMNDHESAAQREETRLKFPPVMHGSFTTSQPRTGIPYAGETFADSSPIPDGNEGIGPVRCSVLDMPNQGGTTRTLVPRDWRFYFLSQKKGVE